MTARSRTRRRLRLPALWQSITQRRRDERDLDEEIRFDLAEETRLLVERGESAVVTLREE